MQWPLSIGPGEPDGRSGGNERPVTVVMDIRDRAALVIAVVLFRTHNHSELRTMTATKLSRPFRERNALEHLDRELAKDLAQEIEICTGNRANRSPRCTASLPSRATGNFCRPQKAREKKRRRRAELGRSRDTLLRAREVGSSAAPPGPRPIVPSGATLVKTCIR